MTLPVHSEISACLTELEAVHSASETHGLLCALLVQDVSTGVDHFLQLLLGDGSGDAKSLQANHPELVLLYQETLKQLQDPLLGLELLLPEEDEAIDLRVKAASQWAGGFLIGWLKSADARRDTLSSEVNEFIDDCKVLVSTEFDTESDDADDEAIYAELIEYLRMGTLLIQEELQPIKAPPQLH